MRSSVALMDTIDCQTLKYYSVLLPIPSNRRLCFCARPMSPRSNYVAYSRFL